MMKPAFTLLFAALMTVSCSVMSRQVRQEAITPPPLATLIDQVDSYRGQTIILGGFLIDVQNRPDQTQLTLLQAPLKPGGKPGPRDRSEGRLIITTSQFFDPEIYTKGREITVGGKITGSSIDEAKTPSFPYLKIAAIELYLWPKYDRNRYRYRYPCDDPFWYWDDPWYDWHRPYYFHGSVYRRYHHRRRHYW